MGLSETRRTNLLLLIEQHRPQKALAEKLGMEPTQLSTLKASRRGIGEKVARRIERKLKLPTGWLDISRGRVVAASESGGDYVEIPPYAGRSSTPMSVHTLSVSRSWVDARGVQIDSLVVIDVPDDSQLDRPARGDPVVVNTEWGDEVQHDRLYVLHVGTGVIFRRAQRQPNGDLLLVCRNERYPDERIARSEIASLDIVGVCESFSADL